MRSVSWIAAMIGGVALLAALGMGAGTPAQEAEPPGESATEPPPDGAPAHTLDDLGWIVGDWRGSKGPATIVEESWREPIGASMVGTFRWMHKGEVRFYEIMVIEMEEGVPTMRIRHFSRGLEPWDKEDEGIAWPLVERAGERAVFRNAGSSTITMTRSGEDGLDIEVNILQNQQGTTIDFDLTRYER